MSASAFQSSLKAMIILYFLIKDFLFRIFTTKAAQKVGELHSTNYFQQNQR